jgi:RecB family exonuclease
VLEDFYKKFGSSAALAELDETAIADELNELTAKHMHSLPGMRRKFMRTLADLETQRLLPLLMNFVALDRERASFMVAEAEEDREVKVGPLSVGLKLDRMDELDNGVLLVVDYKTGNVERKSWNPARPADMQLPLYATFTGMEIAGIAFAQLSAQDVKYEGLADDAVAVEGILQPAGMRTQSKFTDSSGAKIETWGELTQAWRECLLGLAEGFAAGDCSINPKQSAKAEGQFAVLTRVYDLPGVDVGGNDNDG